MASFVARALREQAYAVDVTETGERALSLALQVCYDTILLDLRLPDGDGIEVCRTLRDNGEAPDSHADGAGPGGATRRRARRRG